MEMVPKTRHLSVRDESDLLGRRNSHKETMTRLKPSFGPTGVNVDHVDNSSLFNRKVETKSDKHLIHVKSERRLENVPTSKTKNCHDDSHANSSDVLVKVAPKERKVNNENRNSEQASEANASNVLEESKPTNDTKNNKNTSSSKSIQRQPSPLKSDSSFGDKITDTDDGIYEYSSEIVAYLKSQEKRFIASPDFLISGQVTHAMRSLLSDWLIQCQHHLKFCQETLYLAISILDHVLSVLDVEAGQLQLVGVTAFRLASKLEEYYPAEMTKLTYLTEQSYTVSQILRMEMSILRLVDFKLHYPDPMVFLKRFSRSANLLEDDMFYKTCQLLMDSYIVTKEYPSTPPSLRAASSVMGALQLYKAVNKGSGQWTDNLKRDSGYSSDQVAPVALDMLEEVWKAATVEEYRYKGAYVKYKSNSLHKRLVLRDWLRPQVIAEAKEELKCLINL